MVKLNQMEDGCGGLIKNHKGEWIRGFMRNLGRCKVIIAEIWGVLGLKMVWEQGYKNIVLESDSKTLVKILPKKAITNSSIFMLHCQCQRILERDWTVEIRHTYKEGNRCADWLANYSLTQSLGSHISQDPPSELLSLLLADALGVATPRLISK